MLLPKPVGFSAPWTDARFYFLRLGRRRAVRASMWFGGGALGNLRPGYERQLQRGMRLVRASSGYELHGAEADLQHFIRLLKDQERCDRKAK